MGDRGKGQKFGIKIPNWSFEWSKLKGYRGKKIKLAFDFYFHNIILRRTCEQDEKALTVKQFSLPCSQDRAE